jgi:cation transport protein ChaC
MTGRTKHCLDIAEPGPFWFFAYGSLMWDPPFAPAEAVPARIYGWHRSFCVSSENYRGTRERPGLSLGLDYGGSCMGVALRIDEAGRETAIREIEAREMADDPIYICRHIRIHLADRAVAGYTLAVNRADRLYSGKLPLEEAAGRIAGCAGRRGPNIDYLANTVAHLDDIGISEGALHALLRRTREIQAMAKRGGSD